MFAGPSSQLFVYNFDIPTNASALNNDGGPGVSLGPKALLIPMRKGAVLWRARASLVPKVQLDLGGSGGATLPPVWAYVQIENTSKRRSLTPEQKGPSWTVLGGMGPRYGSSNAGIGPDVNWPAGVYIDAPLYLNWALQGGGYLKVTPTVYNFGFYPIGSLAGALTVILETMLGPA